MIIQIKRISKTKYTEISIFDNKHVNNYPISAVYLNHPVILYSKTSKLVGLSNVLILSELDDGVFVQNQVVRTKFYFYVFITVTVDISAGELLVSEGIIHQVVSGSVLTR